jgi:membrane protein YqaA with SNARE-associated domain
MLAKLTAALVAFGPLGILVLAFIDSSGIPVASGMDALVILVAAKSPSRAVLAASMGVLGSLIGNVVLFLGARAGGRRFVKAPQPGDKQRFREWFERYGLLTIFIPCMLPIPLPLKVFVISAAVLHTPLRTFALVIVLGRSIRYFGEAYLGVMLGEGSAHFLRAHTWHLLGGAVLLFAVLYALLMLAERRRTKHAGSDLPQWNR